LFPRLISDWTKVKDVGKENSLKTTFLFILSDDSPIAHWMMTEEPRP